MDPKKQSISRPFWHPLVQAQLHESFVLGEQQLLHYFAMAHGSLLPSIAYLVLLVVTGLPTHLSSEKQWF